MTDHIKMQILNIWKELHTTNKNTKIEFLCKIKDLRKKNKKIKGYDPILNNTISKKNNLVVSSKEFKSFDIYILVTNHSIILRNLKKLDKNKTIINVLD